METTGATPESLLQEAFKVAEVGDLDAARRLVAEALRLSPNSVQGWSLGARLAANSREEAYCLIRVLQSDPRQAWASTRLRQLMLEQTSRMAAISAEAVAAAEAASQMPEAPLGEAITAPLTEPSPIEPVAKPLPGTSGESPLEQTGQMAAASDEAAAASEASFQAPETAPPDVIAPAEETPSPVEATAISGQGAAGGVPSSVPAPSRSPSVASHASRTTPPRARPSRRRRLDPVFIFLSVMAVLFAGILGLTAIALISRLGTPEALPVTFTPLPPGTAAAATPTLVVEDCQAVIARALKVAENSCSQMGSNQVCYGNTQLIAQLAPGATYPFQARGDIIGVDQLRRVSASPLDITSNNWGVAIFKLLANVPRSLPGQNVTFIVYGNTSLDNASGDLQAFYFSSHLGQISCARLPADGILIHMPDSAGLTFSANGAAITLLGTAELKASANQSMTVSVASGSASVSAVGVTQIFGAGQQVTMPLGGAGGLEPAGPPKPPQDIAGGLPATCALLGVSCSPGDVQRIDQTQAAIAIAQAMATATATRRATPGPLSTISATPSPLTRTPTRTSTRTSTPSATQPASPTPSLPTGTSTATATTMVPTFTRTPTKTPLPPTVTASYTLAPTPTATATLVPTETPTSTPTETPPCQLSAGSLGINGASLTLSIQNGGATPATIVSMTLDWPNTPADQKIMQINLGGTLIDISNYNNPPSAIPLNGTWTAGQPADRQLLANSGKDLEFVFQDALAATGYGLTVTFDNGCSVSATR